MMTIVAIRYSAAAVAKRLSAKSAPCGCDSDGWESCSCDYGEGRGENDICSCHRGAA